MPSNNILPESVIASIGRQVGLGQISDMLDDEQYKTAIPILMAFGGAIAAYVVKMMDSPKPELLGPPRHLSVDRRRGVDRRWYNREKNQVGIATSMPSNGALEITGSTSVTLKDFGVKACDDVSMIVDELTEGTNIMVLKNGAIGHHLGTPQAYSAPFPYKV